MASKYSRLVSLYENCTPAKGEERVRQVFDSGVVKPGEIDLGRLFHECYGAGVYHSCKDKETLVTDVFNQSLTEAEGAVSTAAFLGISGQIVYRTILDAYQSEEFVFSKIIPDVPATILGPEKIAGISKIGNAIAKRKETEAYSYAGITEDWINAPPIVDRGVIVALTWEVIFNDRTGILIERASGVGESMGIDKENRAIDAVIDENTTDHRYNWRGTQIATFGDNSGAHTWDNLSASNTILDFNSLNTVEQVINGILDPYTGEVTTWDMPHLIVTMQNLQTARRIVRAGEIRVTTPGYATTANPTQTNVANPYSQAYQIVSSRRLATRLATDTDWFVGNIPVAVKYRVAQPMRVIEAPTNSHDEFTRQIVRQWRVNEFGQHFVAQPRALIRATVA